jgi:hypothetical protein
MKIRYSERECHYCKKVKKCWLHKKEYYLCMACYRRVLQPKHECVQCKQVKVVANWNRYGKPVCNDCYREQTATACAKCQKKRKIARRLHSGNPVCEPCNRKYYEYRRHILCVLCGFTSYSNHKNREGQPVCPVCYRKKVNVDHCLRCSRVRRVYRRDKESGLATCFSCARVEDTAKKKLECAKS